MPHSLNLLQGTGTGLFSGVKLTVNGATEPSVILSRAPLHPPAPSPPHNSHSKYLEQLRSLNVSVSEWITQHVRENPFVDLTPIFRDYEGHLKSIDNKVGNDTDQ